MFEKGNKLLKRINLKKEISCFFFIHLIGFGFLFGFLWVVLSFPSEPEFKITKEECHMEENKEPCWNLFEYKLRNVDKEFEEIGCKILERYNALEKSPECILLKEIQTNSTEEINDCFFKNNRKEICEQVEVDEMIINDTTCVTGVIDGDGTRKLLRTFCPTPNFIDKFGIILRSIVSGRGYDFGDCPNPCMNYNTLTQTSIEYREIIMSKEDLTIEWLDKNCECLKTTLKYKNIRDEQEVLVRRIRGQSYDKIFEEMDILQCFNYKCGEYLVEVLE